MFFKKILERIFSHTIYQPANLIKEREILSDTEFNSFLACLKEQVQQQTGMIVHTGNEQRIVAEIRKKTAEMNVNNVTRTRAYLSYYKRNPEVHWAFLAHMVSRNGGYYMTDLKSEYLDHLLHTDEGDSYFHFLERCNAYIFNDAYPQLLLYEYSKKRKTPLFELLRSFHVSVFMRPVWEMFFKNKNSSFITAAMIINEQKMLETRVIKGLYKSATLTSDLLFKIQESLGFTAIYFPESNRKNKPLRLKGVSVTNFSDVDYRIRTGKKLYQLLFFSKKENPLSLSFASKQEHTGSRADYWGWLFTNRKKKSAKKLFSPALIDAWKNQQHFFIQKRDWYHNPQAADHLRTLDEVFNRDMTDHALGQIAALTTLDHLSEKISSNISSM
ncbi:DUF2515 family protein [Mesobacillus harenae]|uniref:DUF2515 family protein n=1 Tax=Mesobacillus harenae TaxID=2213203 RepID=UPI0015810CA3|nr:DUF2515 family protein [Mesobacillus harenae]